MKKINICVIAPDPLDSTSLYRSAGPFGKIARDFEEVKVSVHQAADIKGNQWAIFQNAHIVFYQRPFRQVDYNSIALAKNFGLPVIIDYDDDLYEIQKDNPVYAIYKNPECVNAIKECCKIADAITVSTNALKDATIKNMEVSSDKVFVIKNGFDPRWFQRFWNFKPERKKIITWRGTSTHRKDCEEVAAPFSKFMKENEDYLISVFGWVNDPLTYDLPQKRFEYRQLPVIHYHMNLHQTNGLIGIVPLVDNLFNRAKSNIGFIELVSSGHMCIAKDLPEFSEAKSVTYKEPEEFYDKLTYYTKNHEQAMVTWRNQFNYMFNNLSVVEPNNQRMRLIRELI